MPPLLREPLVWFLLGGVCLFVLDRFIADGDASQTIELGPSDIAAMAQLWEVQAGRPPTTEEMNGLIAERVRAEVLYREATRMGLGENDTIIRRRLVQKLTFLTEDLATATAPTQDALRDYYAEHSERYLEPPRFSFQHIFFAESVPDEDISAAYEVLESGGDHSTLGSPFMLRREYNQVSQTEVARQFGVSFASAAAAAATSSTAETTVNQSDPLTVEQPWLGPVASAYGRHLVKITDSRAARQPAFEAITARLAADYEDQVRRSANDRYYTDLLNQYEVSIAPVALGQKQPEQ